MAKDGIATAIVFKTGPETYMGKIADLTISAEATETTLQKEINAFIKIIAIVAVFLGVLFFVLGFIIRYPVITNFIFAIGIVVANVPEGLIAALTVCLTLTAKRMFKNNIMVKNLQSVETLGAITCICSDKTGTLTQNKMTVVHLWYDKNFRKVKPNQKDIEVDNDLYKLQLYEKTDHTFEMLKIGGVCGSENDFVQDVPDDFPPFLKDINDWKKSNEIANEDQIKKKSEECILH